MPFAYSNNGFCFRMVEPDWPLADDEILLNERPSEQELLAAFPGRTAVKQGKALDAIKAERERRTENGGVQVDGRWFDTDTKSALRYKILADTAADQGLPDDFVIRESWRPMDVDTMGPVDMSYGLLKRIIAAGIAQAMSIDDAAETHKALLFASPDPSSYDFAAGWPETFRA